MRHSGSAVRDLSIFVFGLALVACGAGAAPSHAVAPEPKAAAAPSVPSTPLAKDAAVLARTSVKAAIAQGLGVLLQHVDLSDQPMLVGGKFHGFRIAELRDAPFWQGVDLMAGDVVTSVNGFPIERPEQAQKAFESLESARELRVAYERNGKPRELVIAIVDK